MLAIVTQSDGKIVVGGDFTTLGGGGSGAVPRTRLGRLNIDGSVDSSFDPQPNGVVRAVAIQSDGKIVIGGDFTTVSPHGGVAVTRNRILRLNPDGTVDGSFNPSANAIVRALAIQDDGKILVGGDFTNIGGQPREGLARLDPTNGTADSFAPTANNAVLAIAVQQDGKILAGGVFTSIAGQQRFRIARLNQNGTLDGAFNPNANGVVRAVAVQPDGKVLLGGGFTSIGGVVREGFARLNPSTGAADSFAANANNAITAIALQADGKILVGGDFSIIAGQQRSRVARLDAITAAADGFNPSANSSVLAVCVQADGKVLFGGTFTSLGSQASAIPRSRIARVYQSAGDPDQDFAPAANGTVRALAVQTEDNIIVGGSFTTLGSGGISRERLGRISAAGAIQPGFNPGVTGGSVFALAVQPDGKILVGGNFTGIGGGTGSTVRQRIARLHRDGSVDAGFNPGANGDIFAIAVQPDGKVLLAGAFDAIGGGGTGVTTRRGIARLNPDGSVDSTFKPEANGSIVSLALQADGGIIVGGRFTALSDTASGAISRNHIGRIKADGFIDSSFNAGANGIVYAVAIQSDNKVVVGGEFTAVGTGTAAVGRQHLARLNADGTPDATFNPGANGDVVALGIRAGGEIVVGGYFTAIGGGGSGTSTRHYIAQLDASGAVDATFSAGTNGVVLALALQTDGKVLLGGEFATAGDDGQSGPIPRNHLARLSSARSAAQQLAVEANGTSIVWRRAAGGPEFGRVTFETSTNGTTYSVLATPHRIAGGWELTKQGLPIATNVFIRARGFYQTGNFNGSSSIAESVLNTVLSPIPPVITSPLGAVTSVNQRYVYQLEASNANSVDATSLPPGLSFNQVLRAIVGTPTTTGSHQIALSASNAQGTTTATLNLNVQQPVSSPVIRSGTSATARVGQPFAFQVITEGGSAATTITAQGLPSGLSLDPETGVISGTPIAEGSFAILLTATDGNANSSSTLQLTLIPESPRPVITSAGAITLTPGEPISYKIEATSVGGEEVSYNLIGALPQGLGFNATTGTIEGTYSGTAAKRTGAAEPWEPLLARRGSSTGSAHPKPLSGGVITNVQVFATNASGTGTFPLVFFLAPKGVVNISTRLAIGTDQNVLIAGFIVTGNAPKKLIIRAIAPSLGIGGALQDPTLELREGDTLLGANDNWRSNQEQDIIATTIPPADNREAALVAILQPGAYTAVIAGKDGSTGIGLAEVYDLGTASLESTSDSRLANLSTRGFVQTNDDVMIGGFIVSGAPTTVIVRAVGPSLANRGVGGALDDTTLDFFDGNGSLIVANDDWRTGGQEQQIINTTVPPDDDRESAVVATINPGGYTAVIRGKDGRTGVALVEVYVLP